MPGKTAQQRKALAKERILLLFQQAKNRFPGETDLAHRYVELARKIAMKVRMHIPKEVKHLYCKHCYSYLLPPYTVRVRLQRGHVARTCLVCKRTMRFPYIREQKQKRKGI